MLTPVRIGSEFLVNTTIEGNQAFSAVTGLSDGRFVVTWADESVTGVSNLAVRAQIFNADGNKLGNEFQVNTSSNAMEVPCIAELIDGRFVVIWPTINGTGIRAQMFNSDGTLAGDEFVINTTMQGGQYAPAVAGLSDGRFLVTWTTSGLTTEDTSPSSVRAQILNADGSMMGPEFSVNTTTLDIQTAPAVTALTDGRFVVTWEDHSQTGDDTTNTAVRAQVFNADGSTSGGEFLVNTTTFRLQGAPDITALSGGHFVVTWQDNSQSGNEGPGYDIRAQVFNGDGGKSGAEFIVNTTTQDQQRDPAIAALGDGRFVVAWADTSTTGGDRSIDAVRAQVFEVDGSKVGEEFLVNTTTQNAQWWPAITALTDKRFVVTWNDESATSGDTSNYAVRAQIFELNSVPTGAVLLSGTPLQNEILVADASSLDDPNGLGDVAYQWLRDDAVIAGATQAEYRLTQADVGRAVSVRVTYTDGIGVVESITSEPTETIGNVNDPLTGVPVIGGTPAVRETLLAQTGGLVDADGIGALAYQWLRDGEAIEGATAAEHILTRLDLGREIALRVTFTDGQGTAESATSAPVTPALGTPGWMAEASGPATSEAGQTVILRLALNAAPTADVTLTLAVDDDTEASLSPPTLTFTPDTWDQVQTVTVTGLDDVDDDGPTPYAVTGSVISADPAYASFAPIPLTNLDDSNDADLQLYGTNDADTLTGLNGDDRLYGAGNRDDLRGGRGNDRLYGQEDDDLLSGEDGDDELYGGYDDDLLYGGDGNDALFGEAGNDTLEGGVGNDTLEGGPGADVLRGGAGDDVYLIDDAADVIEDGGLPTDTDTIIVTTRITYTLGQGMVAASLGAGSGASGLVGNAMGNDLTGNGDGNLLDGAAGNDTLYAAGGNDTVLGGDGDDLIVGGDGAGNDVYIGGAGSDTLRYSSALAAVLVDLQQGIAQALAGGNLAGIGTDTLSGIENAIGGDYADRMLGSAEGNRLWGGDGADTLNGLAGDDFLFGGDSTADLRDLIFGGDGNDSIDGGWGNDDLNGGDGNDTILGGFGADTLIGNGGDDMLVGGAGSDLMFGGPGNDTLNGGFGFDRMNGGTGADWFYHLGIADHASDWVQDYNAADGDVLVFGRAGATRAQFQVNFANTPGAGAADVEEAFVIYRPTGQIMWALVDGGDDAVINAQIGGQVFDLLA